MAHPVILHDYWRSSAGYRLRIALRLKGIAHDRRAVDLLAGDQRADAHLALNPQGLVPVLQIDGHALTQSLAILEYLEETRPEPPLLPRDAGARAQVRAIAQAIACEIHPLSNLGVLRRVEGMAGPDMRARWNRDNIASGLLTVEGMLQRMPGRFCHGDDPTMADCVLVPQLYNADRWGVGFDHLPRICGVARACSGHAAFAAAHPENFNPSPRTRAMEEEETP